MKDEEILTEYSLLVKDNKIAQIDKKIEVPAGETVKRVKGKNKYLMPGLTDMHVHLFDTGDVLLFLANGITSVRIMHGDTDMLSVRDDIKNGLIIGHRMLISSPSMGDPITYYETAGQARRDVRTFKKTGYDYIKICNVNYELFNEIIKTSKEENIKVVGHPPPQIKLADIIAAPMYTTEHFFMLNPRKEGNMKLMGQSGIWHCPTFSVYSTSKTGRTVLLSDENLNYVYPRSY